jgi:hypothetical protein
MEGREDLKFYLALFFLVHRLGNKPNQKLNVHIGLVLVDIYLNARV